MQFRFVHAHIKPRTNASASCENVVKIGSVTLEFEKGVCGIFATTGQKLAYPTEYLSNYWTNLYHTFSISSVVVYVRIIKLTLVLQSL